MRLFVIFILCLAALSAAMGAAPQGRASSLGRASSFGRAVRSEHAAWRERAFPRVQSFGGNRAFFYARDFAAVRARAGELTWGAEWTPGRAWSPRGGWAYAEAFRQAYKPKTGETVIKLEIEGRGDVYIKLYTKEAPKATGHILDLVKSQFYDGQRFHKVDTTPKPYLVQIGDPASKSGDLTGNGGSGAHIPYENSGYSNVAGAVGLARPLKNREDGDSQFYILLDRSSFLDGNYTVFGQVVSGMDVLRKVARGDKVLKISVVSP